MRLAFTLAAESLAVMAATAVVTDWLIRIAAQALGMVVAL